MKTITKFALSLCALAAFSAPAMAHSILINGAPTVTNVGPNDNKYTYNPIVTSTSSVQAGSLNSTLTTYVAGQADFFILVDFNGYIAGTAFAPTGWVVTDTNNTYGTPLGGGFFNVPTGTTASNSQTFFDDPSVPDLLFSYVRGSEIDGEALLGQFGGDSTFAAFTFDSLLEAQDHQGTGGSAGTIGNADLYLAPGPNVGSTPTPLPAAAWGGMGLMGLLGGMKMMRRRR